MGILGINAGRSLTRRSATLGVGGAVVAWAAAPSVRASADFTLRLAPPLRSLARTSGIKFGCAASAPSEQQDSLLLKKIATEANIFVPEVHLKWEYTEPAPNVFDFTAPDSIADFAVRHDMIMHGHTLVWHGQLPGWSQKSRAEGTQGLHWNVISKLWCLAIAARSGLGMWLTSRSSRLTALRTVIWFRWLGIDYVDLAFRLARAADRKTPLSLNEYGFEYATAPCQQRRQDALALFANAA
jgi:endo-1,4-beta-xylanase